MLRRLGAGLIVFGVLFSSVLPTQFVSAATVGSPAPPSAPYLILTSILGGDTTVVEIFNQADTPINTSDVRVVVAPGNCGGHEVSRTLSAGWILSKRYATVDVSNVMTGCPTAKLASLKLLQGSTEVQNILIPADNTLLDGGTIVRHKQRSNALSSSRTVTGVFANDYKKSDAADTTFYNDTQYAPPAHSAGLQILEILPHARDCSPTENDATCGDYVKLHNPTNQPINIAGYRLRIGHKGQNNSITNSFTWGQEIDPTADELMLQPHTYLMLTTRNDGDALSITDSGGYVWLEDAYGVKVYEPVVAYPDAGSETKVGWAWAHDGTAWRWTSTPRPEAANYFPPSSSATVDLASSALEPCPAGKFRNPATNRCKSIVLAASSLTPCGPGQTRNPETNRCRSSVLAASALLTPCKPGQERNPDTNRCRSVLAASTSLVPCDEGEERSPETNRCRKVTAPTSTAASAADKQDSSKRKTSYIVVAAVASLAAGYGIYEYRRDIHGFAIDLKSRIFANTGK